MFTMGRSGLGAWAGAFVLLAATASAQTAANSNHPYGLDPYRPSDAAWLRNYGAVLAAQTPIRDLAALDPYRPTHAAVVRQLGGAIPLWTVDWFPVSPMFGPLTPAFVRPLALQPSDGPAPALATPSAPQAPAGPTSMATLDRPRSNDGISLRFDGQTWLVAGRAVPLDAARFVRIGEHGGAAVYKRADVSDAVIYVQSRGDLVAPFRAKP